MKKVYLTGLALLSLLLASKAQAYEAFKDDSQLVNYKVSLAATATSTSAIIVDLSDTANWPHKRSGQLYLTSVNVQIDKVAASTVTVKLGVVNKVNASSGSVTWFMDLPDDRNVSNGTISHAYLYNSFYYNLVVRSSTTNEIDGFTPYVLSNDKTTDSTTYQNDVNLPNPANTSTAPGVGDLVAVITKDPTNVAEVYISVTYFAQ